MKKVLQYQQEQTEKILTLRHLGQFNLKIRTITSSKIWYDQTNNKTERLKLSFKRRQSSFCFDITRNSIPNILESLIKQRIPKK